MVPYFNKLESPLPNRALWLNWPSGSEEDFFFNFVNVFLHFRNYLPLEKGRVPQVNKLEFLLPYDAMRDVC